MPNTRGKIAERIRVKLIGLARFRKDWEAIVRTIDTQQLDALRAMYPGDMPGHKYLNWRKYLPVSIERLYALNLHRGDRKAVLDVGTGVGYFPYALSHFGHTAVAIDKDNNPIFNDATAVLKIDRRVWEVRAHEPLPKLGVRFDLATAFRTVFNKTDKKVWRVPEWEFFLRDLANNLLADDGRVYIDFNLERDGRPYDGTLQAFFWGHGARINGSKVFLSSVAGFRLVPLKLAEAEHA